MRTFPDRTIALPTLPEKQEQVIPYLKKLSATLGEDSRTRVSGQIYGIDAEGAANQIVGADAAGAKWEYKTVAAGSGVSVTHAANSITVANTAPAVTNHALLSNLTYATAGHTGFEPTITAGTTAQYLRGDKSLATLNSAAVGLGNVEDTPLTTGALCKLATVTGVDAKTVATTALYTVPVGKKLIIEAVRYRVTAFTAGGKSVQAIAQAGGNAAVYNDLIGAYTFTVAANDVFCRVGTANTIPIYGAGAVIYLNITTGSDATTETWAIDVFGYLV